MAFDLPILLWLAPVAGFLLWGLALWARHARIARAKRWSDSLGHQAARVGRFGAIALGLAGVLVTVALAGPRWGSRTVVTDTKGLSLVIAIDISRSMLAEDAAPSRLERAKREARRLVHDLRGDRVGLIAFAGGSYITSPLTVDPGALQLLIEGLDPDIASKGGTTLARAIRQGRDLLLAGEEVADRVLVVFTDGETHDSIPPLLQEAERLHRSGIRLILIAEGGREPARIPVRDPEGSFVGYQRDPNGTVVETSRRDEILNAVADAAEGVVVAAEVNDQAGVARGLVDSFKRAPLATTTSVHDVSRAWIPLLTVCQGPDAPKVWRMLPTKHGNAGTSAKQRRGISSRPAADRGGTLSGSISGRPPWQWVTPDSLGARSIGPRTPVNPMSAFAHSTIWVCSTSALRGRRKKAPANS